MSALFSYIDYHYLKNNGNFEQLNGQNDETLCQYIIQENIIKIFFYTIPITYFLQNL